jgi:hypothetical protein
VSVPAQPRKEPLEDRIFDVRITRVQRLAACQPVLGQALVSRFDIQIAREPVAPSI